MNKTENEIMRLLRQMREASNGLFAWSALVVQQIQHDAARYPDARPKLEALHRQAQCAAASLARVTSAHQRWCYAVELLRLSEEADAACCAAAAAALARHERAS